jgi:uncharacterized protein YndB with AHSA1/START domain
MTIAVIVIVLLAALLAYAATRPDTFRTSRSAVIDAPPERIFPLIDDFARWREWSPWERLDPDLRRTYSGPASGRGAGYAWEGSKKVGQGSMEITTSTPPSRLVVRLDFIKPFEAHNVAEFTLEPEGAGTRVVWAMHGPRPFIMKMMGVFMNMDEMVGKDFSAGLANLKSLAETRHEDVPVGAGS